jgi:alanyl-tRNA synthetase
VTERLFLNDPYLARFEAEVLAERTLGDRPAVILDRTAFYPEGGGQPSDRGTIGGVAVVEVQEAGGEVLHALAGPAPGGRVACAIDWPRRFDHMQQHHGQHLLSAAFEHVLGAQTVSFHLGEETCSIDLDVPAARLDSRPLRAAEAAANEAVWRDLPVVARDFSPNELATLPLRKEPAKGSRVVVVEGFDASPCGGTHPHRTGEVGGVAVLRATRWGEGARVEFVCGGRVVKALAAAGHRLGQACQALRCAPAELPAAVSRLVEESIARRKEVDRLTVALADWEAQRLAARGGGPVSARLEGVLGTAAGLRAVGQALAARGRTALLGAAGEGGAVLCFARPKGAGPHLGEMLRQAAALVGGKGGGAPDLAQGGGPEVGRLGEALDGALAKLATPAAGT